MASIFPIVEGHGEVSAVPLLIRRILHEEFGNFGCSILAPYRLARSKICKFDVDLEKAVRLGGLKLADEAGGVVIIADADDDCPADLQEKFMDFYNEHGFNFPVSFILANKEYEAWMIACGENMRNHGWVRDDAPSHDNPENIRDAKGFFCREILVEEKIYSETVDQIKFTAQIDLRVTFEKCRSFRKFVKEIGDLSAE